MLTCAVKTVGKLPACTYDLDLLATGKEQTYLHCMQLGSLLGRICFFYKLELQHIL